MVVRLVSIRLRPVVGGPLPHLHQAGNGAGKPSVAGFVEPVEKTVDPVQQRNHLARAPGS